jgi:NDP-sugar pyrophosphorylase family protein
MPKPLLPVGHQPLLGSILEKLLEEGVTELAVNAHHLSGELTRFINTLSFKVHVSHEPVILGTAGGVRQVARALGASSVLLVNGDIAGDLAVRDVLERPGPGLTLAVVPRGNPGTGTVGVDEQGQVVRLRGQCFGLESYGADYIGVAHLGEHCLASLPERGCLIGDYALPLLRAGGSVGVRHVPSDFIDVGTLHGYLSANLRAVSRAGGSIVGPGAQLAGTVSLVRSVIADHAEVVGQGALEECVVLPGARAQAPLRRCIVCADGQVIAVEREG